MATVWAQCVYSSLDAGTNIGRGCACEYTISLEHAETWDSTYLGVENILAEWQHVIVRVKKEQILQRFTLLQWVSYRIPGCQRQAHQEKGLHTIFVYSRKLVDIANCSIAASLDFAMLLE